MGDVLGNRRTDFRRTDDRATFADVGVLERCHIGLADQSGLLQTFVEHGLGFVIDGCAVRFNLVVGGHTNRFVVRTECECARVAARESLGEDATNLLRLNGVLELNHVVATAREVDAAAQTHRCKADSEHGDGTDDNPARGLPCRHEAELRVLQQVLRPRRAEREAEPTVFVHLVFIDDAREEHGGEERADDTDDPSRGETANRTRTEHIENHTRDNRSQVRVENSRECVVVTGCNGLLDLLTRTEFFLDALVNQHVGIDRRTERQHHTGDTRHGQCGLERSQNTEREEDVHQQGEVGHHARNDVVHHEHVDHQQHESDDERHNTLLDRLCAERRTDHFFLHDACGSRHTTRFQRVGEVFRVFNGEVTRDRRLTAVDFAIHTRSRINHTVEDDGDGLADVSLCQGSPTARTFRVHRHRHLGSTREVVELVGSIGDDVAFQRCTTRSAGHFQRVEAENVLGLNAVLGLRTPKEFAVGRNDLLGQFRVDDLIDFSRVAHTGVTHERERTLTGGLQDGEQRMLFLGFFELLCIGGSGDFLTLVLHLELLLCLGAVGLHFFHFLFSNLCGGVGFRSNTLVGYACVELHEEGNDFLSVVGLPEFEVGRALQQLTHT